MHKVTSPTNVQEMYTYKKIEQTENKIHSSLPITAIKQERSGRTPNITSRNNVEECHPLNVDDSDYKTEGKEIYELMIEESSIRNSKSRNTFCNMLKKCSLVSIASFSLLGIGYWLGRSTGNNSVYDSYSSSALEGVNIDPSPVVSAGGDSYIQPEDNYTDMPSLSEKNTDTGKTSVEIMKELDEIITEETININGLESVAASLREVERLFPNKNDQLVDIIENTKLIIDSALLVLVKDSNRHNTVAFPGLPDEYLKMIIEMKLDKDSDLYSEEQFSEKTEYYMNLIKEARIDNLDLPGDKDFRDKLIIALTKMSIYLNRLCSKGQNDDCLNFRLTRVTEQGREYEKENNLGQLYGTVGNLAGPRYGSNQYDIVVTEEFLDLCTVQSSHVLIHELVHLFLGTRDNVYIPRDRKCELANKDSAMNITIEEQLESYDNAWKNMPNTIARDIENTNNEYLEDMFKITLKDTAMISSYSTSEEMKEIFIDKFKNIKSFREVYVKIDTDVISQVINSLGIHQLLSEVNGKGKIKIIESHKN